MDGDVVGGKAALVVLALVVATMSTLGPALAASADDDSGGIGITVTTVSSSSSDAPGSPADSSGSHGGSSTVVTGDDANLPTESLPRSDEFDLGGVLYVSGVSSDYAWSADPLGGEVRVRFTVRNVSNEVFDSSARFWLDGPLGNTVSEVAGVRIHNLRPKEIRVVEATLRGVGQWTFLHTHVTLTPPHVVGGTKLTPITRDGFIFVVPWLFSSLIICGAGAFAAFRVLRASRLSAPVRVPV